MDTRATVKVVGQNGQISLGKEARRATAYREGDFMRFLTIQQDHDSTYGKK